MMAPLSIPLIHRGECLFGRTADVSLQAAQLQTLEQHVKVPANVILVRLYARVVLSLSAGSLSAVVSQTQTQTPLQPAERKRSFFSSF